MQTLFNSTFRRIVRCFFAGILAILPLAITMGVIGWGVGFVAGFLGRRSAFGKLLSDLGVQFVTDDRFAYPAGVGVVLVAIFVLGVIVEGGAKGFVEKLFDSLIKRIPLVGSLYSTSQQLVGMVDKKGDTDLKGMQAVFCFFGKEKNSGLLALLVSPERFCIDGHDYQIVIVPTAPVPFGGGMLFVKAELVEPANMTVEALMSIYVSMGVTSPQFLPAKGAAQAAG